VLEWHLNNNFEFLYCIIYVFTDLSQNARVYDGLVALQPNPNLLKKAKSFFAGVWHKITGTSDHKLPEDELSDGFQAMLPSWIDCIVAKTNTIEELISQVDQAIVRQQDRFAYSIAYYHRHLIPHQVTWVRAS